MQTPKRGRGQRRLPKELSFCDSRCASRRARRAAMFESQRDSIIQPKIGRASGLPRVNVQIIHNREAGFGGVRKGGCVLPSAEKSKLASAISRPELYWRV